MTFNNADAAFKHYMNYIPLLGIDNGNGTKAVYNELIHLQDPMANAITDPRRKWSLQYCQREWEWYMTGSRNVREIKKYAPIWDTMHSGDNMVWSNYGFWWNMNHQLAKVTNMLKEDPATRRAVVVHYLPTIMDDFKKDTPCNLVLNFYLIGDKLHLSIMARSIDLWFGFCNDQWIFSTLLHKIADQLKKQIGEMHYFITNLHLYNKHL